LHTYIARLFVSELAQALRVCGPPEKQDSAPSTRTSDVKISACGRLRGLCPCKPRGCAAQRRDCAPCPATRHLPLRGAGAGAGRRVNSSASAVRALPPVRWVAEAPGAAPAAARVAASAAGESTAGRSASSARGVSVPLALHSLARELHTTHTHLRRGRTLRVLASWEHRSPSNRCDKHCDAVGQRQFQ
jgi:hypothetical protein